MRHAMIGDFCTNCGVPRSKVLDVPCMPENPVKKSDPGHIHMMIAKNSDGKLVCQHPGCGATEDTLRGIEVTTRMGGTTDADILERERDNQAHGED